MGFLSLFPNTFTVTRIFYYTLAPNPEKNLNTLIISA
jgi:hypothetical protein